MERLVLVQHCQSHHHVDHEARFWPDSLNGLTEMGRSQAEAVATRLLGLLGESPHQLYSSDMQRATETASIVGRVLGEEPVIIPGVREYCGELAVERTEVEAKESDLSLNWKWSDWSLFDWRPYPEGENGHEFHERVCRGMEQVREATAPERTAVVVLHGGSLSCAVAWWLRLAVDSLPERTPFSATPGSLSILRINQHGNPVVESLNDRAHLPD